MIQRFIFWIKQLFSKQESKKQLPPLLESALFYVERYEAKKEGKGDVKR